MKQNLSDALVEAKQWHQAGELTKARECYQQLLLSYPDNASILHLLGLVFAEEGNFLAAKETLTKALTVDATDPQVSLHLAGVLKGLGEFKAAENVLQSLITKQPLFAAAYNNLGTVYFSQGDYQKARSAFQSALNVQANYIDAYYNLGLSFGKLKQTKEAANTFEALLILAPSHAGALFQLACLRMQQHQLPTAISLFLQLLAQFPNHVESVVNVATCYLRQGDIVLAMQYYMRALELTPNDVQVLFNLGVLLMQQGQLQQALIYYERIVALDPGHVDAHNNIAFIYLGLRDKKNALVHYEAALQLQPGNIALRHTIQILKQDKNIASSPIEYVRSLFDSYADHFDAHLTKALHYQTPRLLFDLLCEHVNCRMVDWDVLDLGCGTGLSGEVWRGKVRSLTGVDISEKMLSQAAKKEIYDELIVADILNFLEDKSQFYDLVMAVDALVYFGELREVLSLMTKAMKPGGFILFNIEMMSAAANKTNYCLTETGRFSHKKEYIDQLLSDLGLKSVAVSKAVLRTQDGKPVQGYLYLLTIY